MASFIQPVRPIDTAPPWNWNPAETFQTAFTLAQENKRAQEKHAAEMELEQILLPYKQKQAALALDKMQFDVELQSTRIDREREFTKQAYRQEIDRMKGLGGGQTENSAEDDFQAVPYQGADAGGMTSPVEGNQPTSFPQEANQAQIASADDQESGYNFSLAGSPFEEGPTNPLYNLPTDDLGERIAMGEASSMGAGSPGGAATVADAASMPVELSLTREDPRGSVGTAPNMLGAENPLERMAEQMPDRVAPPQGQTPEEAQPQSSGDPFYDWSTQTLGPWVSSYNERKAALSDSLAKGRIKSPAFYSGREQLKQKASAMVASALPKLDADQTAQYKTLLQSEVEPIDALLQVSSARPRKRVEGGSVIDEEAAQKERAMLMYNIGEANKNLESVPEGTPEHENLVRIRNQNTQELARRTTPKVKVQDFDSIRREKTKVSRLLEVNPDLGEGSGLVDMFTQTPLQSREEANAYLNRLEQRQTNQLVELETSPESWKFLTSAQRDFKDAKEYAQWEKEAPENTPYINEKGRFTVKTLKPRKTEAPQPESLSADNPFKDEYETAQEGTKRLNSEVATRKLNTELQAYKKQLAELNDAPAPLGSKTWRANQWEKLSKKIREIESSLNELQGS
jgi:hypothetical protein